MRLQYTKAENEVINSRRDEHKNFDGIIVPVEGQGEVITLGLLITDVHRFNMFITNWIDDQGKEDSEIAKEIGADIVHIDYRAPIKAEYLLFLKNYIDGVLYGPTPDPVPPSEEQVILESEPVSEDIEKSDDNEKDNVSDEVNENDSTPE